MRKGLCFALFALFIPLVLYANDAPPGWRAPTGDDLGQRSGWRSQDPDRYLSVRADFDGDGKEETARLLINDKDNKIGLFVFRGDSAPLLIETIDGKERIEGLGISAAKPGEYTTACGKGYWDCRDGEPKQVRLDHPGIDFFKYESANSYFLWNVSKKAFDRLWMSD